MPDEKPLTDAHFQLTRVHERHKTIRWIAVTFGIVVSVWIVANAVVKVMERENPPWVTVVLAIVAALSVGSLPGLTWLRRFRVYIKKHQDRTTELEASVDPSRESSGLEKDGTLPYD